MNRDQANRIFKMFLDLVSSIGNQESCTPGLPKADFITPVLSFSRNEYTKISLQGYHDHKKIEAFVEQLWDIKSEIRQTVSIKSIKDKVVELISQYHKDKNSVKAESFKNVLDELLKTPKQEWLVLSPVYGAYLGSNDPSELGPFTLYTWNAYKTLVNSKDPSFFDSRLKEQYECKKVAYLVNSRNVGGQESALDESYPSDFPMLEDLGNIFIGIQVSARDLERALELSAQRFNQFENVINYMLGYDAKSFEFGVNRFSTLSVLENLSISSGGISYCSSPQENRFHPLHLNSPFFFNGKICFDGTNDVQYWKDYGHAWIWEALKQKAPNKWHERILSSIEWIGRGLRDTNPAKSLVQFTFALEALFSFQEKGFLVSPSIASTLSEFTAFIIADNLSERLDAVKKIKRMYEKRSAVAHGGTQVVPTGLVSESMNLMRDLITKIITNPDLRDLRTIEEVREWIDKKKYS